MKYLFQQVRVVDPLSPWNGKRKNIIIDRGIISEAESAHTAADVVIDGKGCELIPGLCETYTYTGDPGFEHREDFDSVSAAAAAGGVTALCAVADHAPVTQNKTHVAYFIRRSAGKAVEIWPIGAVTEDLKGKNPTEMFDMHTAGAVAFSDAPWPISDAGVMLRALQYTKAFDGVVVSVPYNRSLADEGQMNEGLISVRLGMKGIPQLAESLQVHRDLALLEYGGGRLHFTGISTADAVRQIKIAKAKGLAVTAGVYLHHLLLDETALLDFDTHCKVIPPLRTEADMLALMQGLEEGIIDCVSTQHTPLDTESKRLEFEYALPGMANLELAFSLANTVIGERLGLERLVELFSHRPRQLLGKAPAVIQPGAQANIALIDASHAWTPKGLAFSKSANSPFVGHPLKGIVKGVFNNQQWIGHAGS